MRICLLADGESIHTIRWCRHFHGLGHEIHLISFKDVNIDSINVHYINSGKIKVKGGNWRVIFRYKEVRAVIRDIQPDVLHALYATSYGMIGALSGFHPYIITPLGSDILISPNESRIYRSLLKYAFKKADVVTSMAPHMKDALIELGVPSKKIIDIVLGINTEIFNTKKRKLSQDDFVITSTRNHESVYNIPQFLKAIGLVKDKIPNLKVIMLGDGSLKKELIELTKELKIDNITSFVGKVPQDKVVEVLNSSHVFVTVSLSDGNSLSLIEAMACGAYPIATLIPANQEWIKDGVSGSFVNIGDVESLAKQILNVYYNFDSIIDKATIESDKTIAEKGTWQINMQKMENTYKKITSNGK